MPPPETSAPRRGLLSPPGGWGTTRSPTCGLARPSARPCWHWGVSPTLPPARFTPLQTEVPRVRIGGRTRLVAPRGWVTAPLFFTGFGPLRLPAPDARCLVLRPLFMYGALREQSLAPFKGVPERPSSPATGSGSDGGADAGGSQVQRLVRRAHPTASQSGLLPCSPPLACLRKP